MGEIDAKPFFRVAKRKYSVEEEALEKAAEICSLWEDYLRDPGWHPYKVISVGGKHKVCFSWRWQLEFPIHTFRILHWRYVLVNYSNTYSIV